MAVRKILIAEDDPGVRMTLEFVLKDEGFEVVVTEDGEQALAAARAETPDLIMLDQLMPKLDGRQVLNVLKADENLRGIPVVILTGLTPDDASEWGDAHFVGKPFTPDALLRKLKALLEG